MVTIYECAYNNEGHYDFKCDFGDGMIEFFFVDHRDSYKIPEVDAVYKRDQYTFLCEAESIEQFINEQKLLKLLEE